MECKVLIWFQDLKASSGITSWEALISGMQTWLGPTVSKDPKETLTKLKQATTMEAYKTKFEVFSNQLRGLAESYKFNYFLSWLKEDIRFTVQMLNPPTLNIAYELVKM